MPDHSVPDNLHRFSGMGEVYHAVRPTPPAVIVQFLSRACGMVRPGVVVDLGSGTGLSTRIWTGCADRVIGIEPNADMRAKAEARSSGGGTDVRYQDGLSSATGLPDASVDVVTCSQSLHWMEPSSTFAEAARILRPGGVFAALDCDWPPAIQWEVDAAFAAVIEGGHALERERDLHRVVERWAKHEHLARMRESGQFRYVGEACFHSIESGDAARLVGLAISQGTVTALLRMGYSEDALGITALRRAAAKVLGQGGVPWHFTYRVRYGIR